MSKILVVDDDKSVLTYFKLLLIQQRRFDVHVLDCSSEALAAVDSGGFDLLLLDMDMPKVGGREILRHVREHHPDLQVIVVTGVHDVSLAVESMKLGAYDYLCKPVDDRSLLSSIERALPPAPEPWEASRTVHCDAPELKHRESFEGIVTQARELLQVLGTVEKIADSDNSVLVRGESGTGKELIAKAIHRISRRRDREYLAVNGAEFAADLFSSEFFGHEKGAFTGAVQDKRGLFEKADGGTLLIDEIGELSPPVQAKLLRALQCGEFFRLGSTEQRGADVRIIAATNKDLDLAVEEGTFRRDLYYRLNVNTVFVPPLRERRGDVPLLARHFLRMRTQKLGKSIHSISEDVMTFLSSYEFPGNVRELENLIAGAVVLEGSPVLTMASLPSNLLVAARSRAVSARSHAVKARQSDGRTLAAVEAEHIRETLQHTGGNRTVAAQVLGVSRVGLLGKMKRYGIIGVEEIDSQHREFLARTGEFLKTMWAGQRDRLPEMFLYLDAYLAKHCATEERLMTEYSYPGMAAHQALHQEIKAASRMYGAALQNEASQSLLVEAASWLSTWMREHLRGPDRELGTHLRTASGEQVQAGRRSSPRER
jgi:hemerythrin-like metal-binding protein